MERTRVVCQKFRASRNVRASPNSDVVIVIGHELPCSAVKSRVVLERLAGFDSVYQPNIVIHEIQALGHKNRNGWRGNVVDGNLLQVSDDRMSARFLERFSTSGRSRTEMQVRG